MPSRLLRSLATVAPLALALAGCWTVLPGAARGQAGVPAVPSVVGPLPAALLTPPAAPDPKPSPAHTAAPRPDPKPLPGTPADKPAPPRPMPASAVASTPVSVLPTVAAPPPPANPVVPAVPAPPAAPAGTAVGPVLVGNTALSYDEVVRLTGAGAPLPDIGGGCQSCGGAGGGCDGRCEPFPAGDTFAGRFVGCVYDILCCPDPCYRPKWEPLADAAFVTAAARPVTQTRLQWNYTNNVPFADRGEWFWARADGKGRGPAPQAGAIGVPRVDSHELLQVTEAAAGKASVSVSTPYRSVNPQFAGSAAGFGDVTIGTKSLLLDTEILLVALQFNTTVPSGNSRRGLGTGHVSLEPSLVFGLRLSPSTFLQAQVAEWIPLGGDSQYAGAVLHYHAALNHTLWQPSERVQLVGTLEAHGYSFQDGGFTDPALGFRKASDHTSGQLGTGLRLFFCDQYDFGVGGVYGVTGANQFAGQLRAEMRIRY